LTKFGDFFPKLSVHTGLDLLAIINFRTLPFRSATAAPFLPEVEKEES
jgi:hypothetical protein